ncbi:MAG: hypothetical protein OXH28_06620 [bacterium]|nr:hypothetical protein [bacterium]
MWSDVDGGDQEFVADLGAGDRYGGREGRGAVQSSADGAFEGASGDVPLPVVIVGATDAPPSAGAFGRWRRGA